MQTVAIKVRDIGRKAATPPAAPVRRTWSRIELFLKVSERCNIECTYCYFFFGGDTSFESHPAYITQKTIVGVAEFLARTARESGVDEVKIDFHGGEPMMLKKHRFEEMCATLQQHLSFVTLTLSMQTNAMLIDDDWVDLIAKYDIGIGVSLDGPREENDEHRIDHKGRGTYDRTVAGMRMLQAARAAGKMRRGFGIICVVDAKRDARRLLSHFVDELGVNDFTFALPMMSRDTMSEADADTYTKFMCDLVDMWVERNDPEIRIGFVDQLLGLLVRGADGLGYSNEEQRQRTLFTISSNGELGGQDDERIASYAFGTGAIASGAFGLSDFYATPPLAKYIEARKELGANCATCCWQHVCKGGEAVSGNVQRYSAANGFANHSVYCRTIQAVLVKLTEFALSKGVPFEKLAEVLVDSDVVEEPVAA